MKKHLLRLLSLVFLLLIWQISSCIINAAFILPYPKQVFSALISFFGTKLFWKAFGITFLRCTFSFFITILTGTVLGILCGLNPDFYAFLELPLAIIRATPVVSFILIAIFWFSSGAIPIFISIIMTLPIIITSIYKGFDEVETNLLKMAKVFKLSQMQILFKIQLPAIKSHFFSGLISTFGLTWKVVAAGEVLALPRNGIGTILQRSQLHLESAEVIAVTLFYVAVSFVLEKLLLVLLNLNSDYNHQK